MGLTLIRNRALTPELVASTPQRAKGGWIYTPSPKQTQRYALTSRRQIIKDWATYGGLALAAIIGGRVRGEAQSLASGGPSVWPSPYFTTLAPSLSSVTSDAAGEYHALIFRAPKTGLIRGISILIATATGSPTADFQLETIGATGFPSGALAGTNTSITGVTVTTGRFDSGNFTADYSATQGDPLAAVMRYATGTTIASRQVDSIRSFFPYMATNTGADAKVVTAVSTIGVRYSDGSYGYIPGSCPLSTLNTTTFDSATNPNHRGGVWTATQPVRCVGGWAYTNNNGDYDFIIAVDAWDGTADNDGTSNLTVAIDKDQIGALAPAYILSSKSLDFSVGADYRAIVKPGATSVQVINFGVASAAVMDSFDIGQAFRLTTANNPTVAGDWTDAATNRPLVGFWFDQFSTGGSSGGGRIIGG